jgi:hypothetical protein
MPISRTKSGYGAATTGAGSPNVPITPVFTSNGTNTITFTVGANSNASTVKYAIYVTADTVGKGYLKTDGSDNGASEAWATLATWNAGVITATGLTNFVAYQFKAKAQNEDGSIDSAFSSDSAVMNTLPAIDYGPESDNLSREVTGGNTIVDDTIGITITGTEVASGEATQETTPEYYGDITLTYTLVNNASTVSRIGVEFSEDYIPGAIPDVSSWAAATMGTGGDGVTALTTTPAGVSHTYKWDSYTDSGKSEQDTTVYCRITPYDASPTGGDAGPVVVSNVIAVNNLPAKMTWTNNDGYVFDKDTTPTFRAIIPYLRGGTKGFPTLSIYQSDGTTLVQTCNSLDSVAGWEYETAPDTWTALTVDGIPDTVIDGVNRVKYTCQTALSAAEYIIKGKMGEIRDE